MHEFQDIKREFNLWTSLLQSQGIRFGNGGAASGKASRFGSLRLNKARPVYLSQLVREGKLQ